MSSGNEELKEPAESAENTPLEEMEAEMAYDEKEIVESEDELLQQLKQAEKKAEENWELLLRTKAEMENLRKRTEKDLEKAHKYGMEKFVSEMLPVKDSMELGLAAQDATVESLHEGMELTMSMFNSALEKLGVEEINPENEAFDPELHQAMTLQESAEVEPNTVLTVMQKGYRLNERLIRPAMVVVSKKPE
ncbi:MAG: nucleotide exchange factor GrpE [Thiotrichales bacterium]|nr:MAG: nucleotide exchange factor GrpE [Thiotrichales bacterium]